MTSRGVLPGSDSPRRGDSKACRRTSGLCRRYRRGVARTARASLFPGLRRIARWSARWLLGSIACRRRIGMPFCCFVLMYGMVDERW